MYDGIKIECALTNKVKWDTSLTLIGRHAENTGEVLPLPSECNLNSCMFSRVPTYAGPKHIFQGSLHRYHNNGGTNDNDFTIKDVRKTIAGLEKDFNIIPERSKVLNFEFGVNINLPIGMDAQAFQKYLVSANTKAFEKLNPRRPMVGYIAEFNEFSIKIYDKGYHAQNGATDQVRVEIKVNRTRWLDQFKFIKGKELYLSDLLNELNIKILGDILLNKVRSLILTPREIEIKKLSPKQIQTFYECRDARSWEEWTSKQRERKRAQLSNIFRKVNQADPVDVLSQLVVSKWRELTTELKVVGQNHGEKVNISSIIVDGIRGLFNFILNGYELKRVYSFILYRPERIQRIRAGPPYKTMIGFNRWIDYNCRDPTIKRIMNIYQGCTFLVYVIILLQ